MPRAYLCLLLFVATFVFFLGAVCPTTYWRDVPEFQVVSYQLGIAHPAGSPFYALVTKLFTFFPLGNIALRANLGSAFFSALLICLTFLFIAETLETICPILSPNRASLLAALAAAFYAVSDSLLSTATSAEVYSLQFCFVVLIGLCLVRGLREPDNPAPIYLMAFLFGLSIGAHIIMILFFPALCLFLLLYYRKFLTVSRLGIVSFFFILGASVYLYLPLRSSVNPYYDWGNPQTLENFLIHVTDRKDAHIHFSLSLTKFPSLLGKYFTYYAEDFGFLGIILGIFGLGKLLRQNARLFLALGVYFFSTWPFFIRIWGTSVVFIPTFLFFTLGVALGLNGTLEAFQFWRKRASADRAESRPLLGALAMLCLVHVFFSGSYHWQKDNRAQYWSSYDFHKYVYDLIEPGGILMSSLYYFGTSYLQQCENYRPDVTNLFLSEVISPRVFNKVTPARYPLIAIPEDGEPKIGEAIIKANLADHHIYWDPTSTINQRVKNYFLPHGLLFAITSSSAALRPEEVEAHSRRVDEFLRAFSPSLSRYNDWEESLFYSLVLESLAGYFLDHGVFHVAIGHLSVANRLRPGNAGILNGLASAHANAGRDTEAEMFFKEALNVSPDNPSVLKNLGQLYLDTKRASLALECYQKAVATAPDSPQAFLGLGISLQRLGHGEDARRALQKVILLAPQNPLAGDARKRLADMNEEPLASNPRSR